MRFMMLMIPQGYEKAEPGTIEAESGGAASRVIVGPRQITIGSFFS